jgi:hypothetical protein
LKAYLAPKETGCNRDFEYPEPIYHSVIEPGKTRQTHEEEALSVGLKMILKMDRDCDQVRLLIQLLFKNTEWTERTFRKALGFDERKQMNVFLSLDGPKAGAKQVFYQLAWEFFKRRELLGLPLPIEKAQPPAPLAGTAANGAKKKSGGRKRKSGALDEMDGNVMAKERPKNKMVRH